MTPREQVLETLADFARATDARDWVGLQAMLHSESVGYGQEGVDAIMHSFHHHLGRTGTTQHLLGNHRVSFVDDDTARVYSYARIMHIGIEDQEGKTLELFGEYDDLLVRRSADDPAGTGSGSQSGWLLKRRRLEIHHSIGDWNVIHAFES